MTNFIPREDPAHVEALYRAAEIKALTNHRKRPLPPIEIVEHVLPSDDWLAAAASREVERRAIRMRYLPAEIGCDYGWYVLLDLFIGEYELRVVQLVDAPRRWHMSPATAARQIAALIETNLVVRVFDKVSSGSVTLRLTDMGKMYLKRVLALSE